MSWTSKTQAVVGPRGISKRSTSGSLTGAPVADGYSNHVPQGVSISHAATGELTVAPPKFDLPKLKLRWGGEWLDHRPGRFDILAAFGPPYYNYHAISSAKQFTEGERGELIRFLLTLELWETTPGEKEIAAQDIWLGTLRDGPEYADFLDDFFALSWREREIASYNFSFPTRFLPRWKEYTDDLNLSLQPTWSDPGVLEEFRYTLANLLDEIDGIKDIVLPTDESIIFERSTTTSYIHSQKKTMPQWEASLQCEKFNTKVLYGKRCIVPVYPGGTRDTIIADISANNSIRFLERSLRHVLEHVPESAVALYAHTFQSRLEDVVYTKGYHVLRDIKKCGITYNTHDLFPIVMEELKKRIPDSRWDRMKIYLNMRIIDDDEEFVAKRGYGLGMANHLVTLCNIVIHRMARQVLANKSEFSFKLKAICGNDDEDVVIFGSHKARQLAEEYLEIEHDIHGALGNLINTRKSVVKPYGLFYETYNKRGWEHKEALVCNALACAYLAPSIRVAKHYIYSQSNRFNSNWARAQLRNLAKYWGDEFFDVSSELKIHYEIGGWLDTRSLGLKTTLRDIERLSEKFPTRFISIAAETCRQYMKPPSPAFKTPGIVTNHMYFGRAMHADPKIQLYTLGDEDLRWYYKRLTKYQRNYASRLAKYESRVMTKNIKDDIDDIIRKFLRHEPWYVIPEAYAEEFFPPHTHAFGYKSEQTLHGTDIIENMIKKIQGFPYDLFEEDDNTSWNPQIPTDVTKYTLETDIATQLYASQYSNSGFLPILEYFLRHGAYPKCQPDMGRTRVWALPSVVESHPLRKSLFIHKVPKKRKEQLSETPVEEGVYDEWTTTGIPIIQYTADESATQYQILMDEMGKLGLQEPAPPPPQESIPYNWEEEPNYMESIDQLLAQVQDGLGVANLLPEFESTNILFDSDQEETGGFSIFGDEDM